MIVQNVYQPVKEHFIDIDWNMLGPAFPSAMHEQYAATTQGAELYGMAPPYTQRHIRTSAAAILPPLSVLRTISTKPYICILERLIMLHDWNLATPKGHCAR
nr:hypothetical protein CFP56_10174 [Quercus suber]